VDVVGSTTLQPRYTTIKITGVLELYAKSWKCMETAIGGLEGEPWSPGNPETPSGDVTAL
jgi:hypothetical protein